MKYLFSVKLAAYCFLMLCTPAVQRSTLAARAADDPALAIQESLVSKPVLGTESLPNGLSADDWTNIRAAYEAGRHAACATEGGYRAHNSGQQWTTHFDGQGFTTSPDSGGWTWGLQLEAYGWGGAEPVVAGCAAMTAEGQRVSYPWDDRLTEWYLNDQRGLEHGFTIQARPDDATGQLTLELAVRGDLLPEVSKNGRDVCFIDATGIPILHYAGLTVCDCDDQPLAANWIVVNERLRLQIEDREAHYPLSIDPIAQQAYLKAHNTDPADQFGNAVAVSGNTVIIGARGENNSATGVNPGIGGGPQAALSGAAYIFVRNGTTWTQQAYLKASNTGASDIFGCSVAISGDTAVVGAFGEASSATGVNGDQNNNLATRAGATYVFVRSGTTWTQQAYLKASNTGAWDFFGDSVAISGDTLVVGASGEGSAASVVNGDQSNNAAPSAGAAYVFVRNGTTWTQEAYLKASNADLGDLFGQSITIWGDTIVVGAPEEDSASTGVNGDQSSAAANASGAVYVFVRTGTSWTQQAYIKASNAQASDNFGGAVALSDSTLIVGASNESSAATGVGGDQFNNSAHLSGAAYVFVRGGNAWTQQAYLKASNTDPDDDFGVSVAVSGDTVVVGAREEASSSTGLNGDQSIDTAPAAGAAYVFARNGSVWSQRGMVKSCGREILGGHAAALMPSLNCTPWMTSPRRAWPLIFRHLRSAA